MQNPVDPLVRPLVTSENIPCKFGRGLLMVPPRQASGRISGGVVKENGRPQNFQIRSFPAPNPFGKNQDAQDMIEAMDGVTGAVPPSGLLNCGHRLNPSIGL
jgi:hypothetical protein